MRSLTANTLGLHSPSKYLSPNVHSSSFSWMLSSNTNVVIDSNVFSSWISALCDSDTSTVLSTVGEWSSSVGLWANLSTSVGSVMKILPLGVCLVLAVGLMQDLTLILSTKKHKTKQNKQRKQNPSRISSTGEGFIVKNIMQCVTASNNILENAIPWWRYAVSYCQSHCEEDIAVYFQFICYVLLSMCLSNRMPPVPSPEPGGFVWVGHATNKDLKKKNNKKKNNIHTNTKLKKKIK